MRCVGGGESDESLLHFWLRYAITEVAAVFLLRRLSASLPQLQDTRTMRTRNPKKKKTEIIIKKEAKVWDGIPVSDRAEQFLSPLAGNGNPASVTHEWTSHVVDWSFITNSALGEMRPSDINQMA